MRRSGRFSMQLKVVNIGNGKSCWRDKWGRIVDEISPDVYQLIHPLSRARRLVSLKHVLKVTGFMGCTQECSDIPE
jgi:hypothetical protein